MELRIPGVTIAWDTGGFAVQTGLRSSGCVVLRPLGLRGVELCMCDHSCLGHRMGAGGGCRSWWGVQACSLHLHPVLLTQPYLSTP